MYASGGIDTPDLPAVTLIIDKTKIKVTNTYEEIIELLRLAKESVVLQKYLTEIDDKDITDDMLRETLCDIYPSLTDLDKVISDKLRSELKRAFKSVYKDNRLAIKI